MLFFRMILNISFVHSRMYASTWLERLFQSCQRKSNTETSKEEQLSEDQHRLLSYEQLPNFGNDALV
jgi:bacterioferritin (cytochrome b1)